MKETKLRMFIYYYLFIKMLNHYYFTFIFLLFSSESTQCCDVNAICSCSTLSGHYSCMCEKGYFGTSINGNCECKSQIILKIIKQYYLFEINLKYVRMQLIGRTGILVEHVLM